MLVKLLESRGSCRRCARCLSSSHLPLMRFAPDVSGGMVSICTFECFVLRAQLQAGWVDCTNIVAILTVSLALICILPPNLDPVTLLHVTLWFFLYVLYMQFIFLRNLNCFLSGLYCLKYNVYYLEKYVSDLPQTGCLFACFLFAASWSREWVECFCTLNYIIWIRYS